MKRQILSLALAAMCAVAFFGQSNTHAQSTVYAFDMRATANQNLFSFAPNTPLVQTQIGPNPTLWQTFAMDFAPNGTDLYAVNNFTAAPAASWQIGLVGLGNASYTSNALLSGAFITNAETGVTGLTFDPAGNAFLSTGTRLYSLDVNTGVTAQLATFSGGNPAGTAEGIVIDIAADNAGNIFAHGISTDALYSVNVGTGALTWIGNSLLAGNFAQGMDFDPATNILYAAIYTGGGTGQYGTWDTTTGLFTSIAGLPSFPDPNGNGRELEIAISAIPEPSVFGLLALAATVGGLRRRK